MGGILEHAGIDGFLGNLGLLYESADTEGLAWQRFLNVWYSQFESKWVTAAHIVGSVQSEHSELRKALPEFLLESLETQRSFRLRLGKALEKRIEKRYGDQCLFIENRFDSHAKVNQWRVVVGGGGTAARSETC